MRARARRAISRELVCVMKRRVEGGHRRRGGAGGIFERRGKRTESEERGAKEPPFYHTVAGIP